MTVKELLSDESKWCQFACARDENGRVMTKYEGCGMIVPPETAKFCLLGAIAHCYNEGKVDKHIREAVRLRCVIEEIHEWDYGLDDFNDTHSYKEVMAVVERAGV